ncbi:MAG: hypothetical protein IJV35_09495 [Neisseriaceae bacterium]|nr:hypothetical protein [Neisseriaceae bacterium]
MTIVKARNDSIFFSGSLKNILHYRFWDRCVLCSQEIAYALTIVKARNDSIFFSGCLKPPNLPQQAF